MKTQLQMLTVVALLMAAGFGLRNLVTPATAAVAASTATAWKAPLTGTGGPVPPPLKIATTAPARLTGTGGPVPPCPGCPAVR